MGVNLMYISNEFGRHFWVDDEYNFRSAPSFIDDTADLDNADYVSDWDDWEGVNIGLLFDIHKACLLNKVQYAGSLSLHGV
tara:strand:+ start:250 stop:492 length:243 start_codon:yes stop_codon:yes gene_type:complete